METPSPLKSFFEDILAERRTSNDFRWATKTWSPSPCYVRGQRKDAKEIIQLVLVSDRVQKAIKEICDRDGKNAKDVQKEAQDILTEMAHDFRLYAVRWFAVMLSKISKRLYLSIQVNTESIQKMKQAFLSYPVILLPTHRSYVDFLLVSYMFFHYNLPLPVIAAGMDFMGMVGIGEMLRRSGAFFIRRKFGGDTLYWALVSEYVKKCALTGAHPVEMFVEGTRSRSGKSISPKIGLLSAMLEMVWNAEVPDILILPISMSYDRTLEEKLYAHELLGQPKPKESTNGLIKALRWLSSQSYGSIYVNFGDLISVRQYFDKKRFASSIPTENSVFSKTVLDIAVESVLQHQKHLVVPIFPCIATVILAKISREHNRLQFDELMQYLLRIETILASRNNRIGVPNTGESFENNVRLILSVHSSLVTVNSQDKNVLTPIVHPNIAVQSMQFQHYANQLLPLILPCCLVAVLSSSIPRVDRQELSVAKDEEAQQRYEEDAIEMNVQFFSEYVFLRRLLQEDFPYHRGSEHDEFTWAVSILQEMEKIEADSVLSKSTSTQLELEDQIRNETFSVMEILKSAIEPYLISYWGMTATLLDVSSRTIENPCGMKQLGKMCQDFIHQKMKTTPHLPKQYGALSLESLSNAILSSVQSLATSKVKLEDGSFGIVVKDNQQLSSTLCRLEKLVRVDGSVLNTKRHSIESNFEIEEVEQVGDSNSSQEQQGEEQQLQLRSKL